jgi:molybdate transport system permease protein
MMTLTAEDWRVAGFTAWVAGLATLAAAAPGILLAWTLARGAGRWKVVVETLVTLPLLAPPVATGLVLLELLGRRGPIGGWLHTMWGVDVVFTWKAVAVAMAVMSFPLFVRSARTAFEEVDRRYEGVAATLGLAPAEVFFRVTLPLARRGLASGLALGFARALGEFGATVMVAGNIPGRTSTLALAIYQAVQTGDDARAARLAALSAAVAFAAALAGTMLARRKGA